MRTIILLLKYALYALVLWMLVHTVFVVREGLSDTGSRADIAVVLGNKVNEDGSLSDRLRARLDKAVELFGCRKGAMGAGEWRPGQRRLLGR